MMGSSLARRARTTVFDLDPEAARLETRGFAPTSPDKRERLEEAGLSFVEGYRAAIRTADARDTAAACDGLAPALRGFAFEGGGMGLALLDLVSGGVPRRFRALLGAHDGAHMYMLHVGAGWAIARCPWGAATFLPGLDPLLRWLTVDGIGFHAAFFHPVALLDRRRRPLLRACGPDAFDAGLGRALWFASGAQPSLVVRRLAAFEAPRHGSLWGGLGLAVAYAGGASDPELRELKDGAGAHAPRLAVGAAFAAGTRQRAGNPVDHTDRACRVFCGAPAADVAIIARDSLDQARGTADPFRRCIDRLTARFSGAAAPHA